MSFFVLKKSIISIKSKTGSRAFDRSLSSGGGGSWYADRSASNGPASAGIIGPGGPAEDGTNNGSMSPR